MATLTFIMSDYLEDKLINHILKGVSYSPPAGIYIALYTSNPGELGTSGTEVSTSGTGYTRKLCPSFTIANGVATLSSDINFPLAILSWGTVSHFGLRDNSTGGNLLFYGSLYESLPISNQNCPVISANGFSISLIGDKYGGWGSGTATDVLNFVLNGGSYPTPGTAIYLALGNSLVTDTINNFSSWLEISGGGYTRKSIGNNWTSAGTGNLYNTSDIIFTEKATSNWGNISHCVLFNSTSAGDHLFWGIIDTPRNIAMGDGVKIPSYAIEIRIDTPRYPETP